MPTTPIAADTVSQPIAEPSDDKQPPRPEDQRPGTDGDRRVGDIDDLPRPDWNDAPEDARGSLASPRPAARADRQQE
jgi:hypothetical protein